MGSPILAMAALALGFTLVYAGVKDIPIGTIFRSQFGNGTLPASGSNVPAGGSDLNLQPLPPPVPTPGGRTKVVAQ